MNYPIILDGAEPYDLNIGTAVERAIRTAPNAPPAGPREPRPSEAIERPAEFPTVPGVFWSAGVWIGQRGYLRKRFSLTAYGTYAAAYDAAVSWVREEEG